MVIPNKNNLTVIDSSNNSSHGKGTYSISIVNTKTNGKRIKLSLHFGRHLTVQRTLTF